MTARSVALLVAIMGVGVTPIPGAPGSAVADACPCESGGHSGSPGSPQPLDPLLIRSLIRIARSTGFDFGHPGDLLEKPRACAIYCALGARSRDRLAERYLWLAVAVVDVDCSLAEGALARAVELDEPSGHAKSMLDRLRARGCDEADEYAARLVDDDGGDR